MEINNHQYKTTESIEALLKYLSNDKDLAVYVPSRGGGDVTEHRGNYAQQRVWIHNGRLSSEDFNLDKQGFVFVKQPSRVNDFYNDEEIEKIYDNEVKSLVRAVTSATRVEIFDHTHRAASLEVQKARTIREPASIVHNDYTSRSGPKRLCDHFSDHPGKAEALMQNRFAIINVWRSIAGTVHNAPLALCDASSVAAEELIPVERRARERVGEIQLALYNSAHRWYYFPEMEVDEALIFKTYDSATDGRARFTIHTSFQDSNTEADTPSRESIETRCFVFF